MTSTDEQMVSPMRVAAAPMAAVSVCLLVVADRHGPHWDELYFRMLPVRWWYEDQPPLTVWLTQFAALLSDSLWVQRLPAIGAAAAGALVAGMIPRSVGAGVDTQRLAAWAHAFTVYPLIMGHIFTTSTIDLLAWQVVILLVLRATLGHRASLVWAAAVAGVACWNKLLVVLLVGAVALSLLWTDRHLLRSRATIAAAGIFAILAGPQLILQALHGFPMADVSAGLVEQRGNLVRLLLLPALAVFAGPPLLRVWVSGLVDPWRATDRPGRFLLPAVLLLIGFNLYSPSQPYYPMGAILAALSLGWASPALRGAWDPAKRLGIVAANSIIAVVVCLPVLLASGPWMPALTAINPTIRDQLGWQEYAEQMVAERKPDEAVITGHYVLAGALDRYHPEVPVHSGHNALWRMGPPQGEQVLLVGVHATGLQDHFAACTSAGSVDTREDAHPALGHVPMLHCADPIGGWAQVWPAFSRLSG